MEKRNTQDFVTIVDDAIPEPYLKDILNCVNVGLPWDYLMDTDYKEENPDIWNKMMSCSIILNGERFNDAKQFDFFYPVIYLLEKQFDKKFQYVYRMKINKTFTVPEDRDVIEWHTDVEVGGYKSIVLYLDDSDGDTFVSDLIFYRTPDNLKPPADQINYYEAVQIKKNRAVMFDSHRAHHAEYPRHHKCRTILNLVVTLQESVNV